MAIPHVQLIYRLIYEYLLPSDENTANFNMPSPRDFQNQICTIRIVGHKAINRKLSATVVIDRIILHNLERNRF